jgi:F0F1-type ATP synthase membrane subunit b/b'
MPRETINSVEALEGEAEKILEEAKARANQIILDSREEAKKIVSSQPALDEVKAECEKIVGKAKVEADKTLIDSEKKAAEIRANAGKKAKEITELLVNIVRGKS